MGHEPEGCTLAPSRYSISVASPIGSSQTVSAFPMVAFGGIPMDMRQTPTRHNYLLALWQSLFEPILAGWVNELGVPILRGYQVVGFTQDASGVDVDLSDGRRLRAHYLIGCDGGRSQIRKATGIDFVGVEPSTSWMIAEVEMADEPEIGMRSEGGGIGPVNRAGDGGAV